MAEPDQALVGEWLKATGPESDIVISSRVRLARNVSGFRLKARLPAEETPVLCEHLRRGIEQARLAPELHYHAVDALDEIGRTVLVERHLISLEHANTDGERGVICDRDGTLALMLNEEDHLRIQVIASGLALEATSDRAQEVVDSLEGYIEFAFHPRFGYLTSCPTNVGTGMRISVMLHLPALVMTKQIDKVFNSVAKMNLAVRGFYGEGTKALSDLYQISNQVTLGKTPETLREDLARILPRIVAFERDLRQQLLTNGRVQLEDRVWRAYGALRFARTMTSEEAFELLSAVRMGVHLELLPDLDLKTVNHLFMICQPGHLQLSQGGKALEPARRDELRAVIVRERLKAG